jgi:hypothetical protein
VDSDLRYILGRQIWSEIKSQLSQQNIREIRWGNEHLEKLFNLYIYQVFVKYANTGIDRLNHQQRIRLTRLRINIPFGKYAAYASQSDFCISVLNCGYDSEKWEVFKSLINDCGLIFCYEQPEDINDPTSKLISIAMICDCPML